MGILCKFRRNVGENIRRIGIKALKLQQLMEMNLAAVEMILKKGKKERTKNTKKTKMQRSVRKRKRKRRKNEAKRTKICSNREHLLIFQSLCCLKLLYE